ncbi:AAA family ATPase [bacterium]|nr:AAA family ATPase [bacterium]
MKRIAVIGPSCSGKSTLARRIGAELGIEVIHLDQLYWRPGWVATPEDEWRRIQEELTQRSSWVIDGNYGMSLDIRLEAADTVIFLDFPRLVSLWRMVKRLVGNYGKTRSDLGVGCRERIDLDFIKWIWDWPNRGRLHVQKMLHIFGDALTVFTFRRSREVRWFLTDLSQPTGHHSSNNTDNQ